MKKFMVLGSFYDGMAHLDIIAKDGAEARKLFFEAFGDKVHENWTINIIDTETNPRAADKWHCDGSAYYCYGTWGPSKSWIFSRSANV